MNSVLVNLSSIFILLQRDRIRRQYQFPHMISCFTNITVLHQTFNCRSLSNLWFNKQEEWEPRRKKIPCVAASPTESQPTHGGIMWWLSICIAGDKMASRLRFILFIAACWFMPIWAHLPAERYALCLWQADIPPAGARACWSTKGRVRLERVWGQWLY